MSLTTISHLQGTEEGMENVALLPGPPYTTEVIQTVKSRLLSWDEYRRFLYSEDFKSSQIIVKPVSIQEAPESADSGMDSEVILQLVRQLNEIIQRHQVPGFRVLIAGEGVANLELLEGINVDSVSPNPLPTLDLDVGKNDGLS